jgi:GMP synthase-like glutamine amidotransferase
MQCMRVKDRLIYAAQFHIEMQGSPEVSRCMMSNFLALASAQQARNTRRAE